MSTIGGQRRETTTEFTRKVGLFEANVIAINPTVEEFKTKLGIELKEDSKAAEYLGTNKESGNTFLRIDVWLKEVKDPLMQPFKVSFFVEDKVRENKDGTKKQYINTIGNCAWAADPNDLPDWFAAREYREANVGEEELYEFIRVWLSELDYRHADTSLMVEWKKLMKGNTKDLKDQIDGEWCKSLVALATVITREKDGEVKEYQNVYNKGFLSPYSLRNFKLIDYSNKKVLTELQAKKSKDLKPHERFVLKVTGEYGCKDFYILRDIQDYTSEDNLVASNDTKIDDEDGDY